MPPVQRIDPAPGADGALIGQVGNFDLSYRQATILPVATLQSGNVDEEVLWPTGISRRFLRPAAWNSSSSHTGRTVSS